MAGFGAADASQNSSTYKSLLGDVKGSRPVSREGQFTEAAEM